MLMHAKVWPAVDCVAHVHFIRLPMALDCTQCARYYVDRWNLRSAALDETRASYTELCMSWRAINGLYPCYEKPPNTACAGRTAVCIWPTPPSMPSPPALPPRHRRPHHRRPRFRRRLFHRPLRLHR